MIERIKGKDFFQHYWYKLSALFVFFVVISIVTRFVTRLDRGLNHEDFRVIVLIAGVLGWLFSTTKKENLFLNVLASIAGSFIFVFGIVGNLFHLIQAILLSLSQNISLYLQYVFVEAIEVRPDTEIILGNWDILTQSTNVLFDRLIEWITSISNPVYAPVSLNLGWGMILWFLSLWLFWFAVNKKKVMLGFIPSILTVAGVYRTVQEGLLNLLLILGIGMILNILAEYSENEDHWFRYQYSVTKTIRSKTTQYSILLSVLLVSFATLLSSPRLDDIIEDWRERRQQAYASGQADDGAIPNSEFEEDGVIGPEKVLGDLSEGLLPNVHLIGSTPELAEIEVLHVRIEDVDNIQDNSYYLRSATYEYYYLEGWEANNKGYVFIPPEDAFEIDFTPYERLIFQEVTLLEFSPNGNLMYLVGELSAANVTHYASYHTKFVNETYTDLFATVTESTQYAAYSKVPSYGEDELRNTSNIYPEWIENKYLQLPDTIPDRVFELALSLTGTQPTPYDRALAIESYLRQFEYSLDIDSPPSSRDIVDYFLFDMQKGYCDYFASSMVVLSRAAGLPARLATGYLASTYLPETGEYVVTADQAHSWVEVYFPEYGWVTFEPTSGRPAISRPQERLEFTEDEIRGFDEELSEPDSAQTYLTFLPGNLFILVGQIAVLLIVLMISIHWIDLRILKNLSPHRMFSRMYSRLQRYAQSMGVQVLVTDTPMEFYDRMSAYFIRFDENSTFSKFWGSASEKVESVIRACNQAAYTEEVPDQSEIDRIISIWGKLRWQIALMRILIRLQPLAAEIRRVWTRLQQPA